MVREVVVVGRGGESNRLGAGSGHWVVEGICQCVCRLRQYYTRELKTKKQICECRVEFVSGSGTKGLVDNARGVGTVMYDEGEQGDVELRRMGESHGRII